MKVAELMQTNLKTISADSTIAAQAAPGGRLRADRDSARRGIPDADA